MEKLIDQIQLKTSVNEKDMALLERLFVFQKVGPNTRFSHEGSVERYVYFLSKGIVKGFRYSGGKIVVEHLVAEGNFFSSFESFMQETPAPDNFESITECEVYKISKPDFLLWKSASAKWNNYMQEVVNDHLNCKLQRVRDFQTLTARERYMKFVEAYPTLVLQVKVDTIASFLGIEPQSLSRIRRQILI
jgi:CRP-like cAMP-binding protein